MQHNPGITSSDSSMEGLMPLLMRTVSGWNTAKSIQ